MIIGSGLVAGSFVDIKKYEDVIIFASGVSNSSEEKASAYLREQNLLLEQDKDKKIIYFSTCSVFDKKLSNTPYVLHKLKMEQIIASHFKTYNILRLPTLVGNSGNSNIFFNYFKVKLKNNEPVTIFKNATRHLLAIDDLSNLVDSILAFNRPVLKMNVAFNNKASVNEIVCIMKDKLNSKSNIILEDSGDDLEIDNTMFISIISNDGNKYLSKNYMDIISKYI